VKAKTLLIFELLLLFSFSTLITGLMLLHSYTFHFERVTLNFYTNGTSDFTTDATGLVRSLGTIAMLTLMFGIATGTAVGLTYNAQLNRKPTAEGYEEKLAKAGFVKIEKTSEGTTYQLTEHGRRFLSEYRFLEKLEKAAA
jgi:predicted transcriptional regulator